MPAEPRGDLDAVYRAHLPEVWRYTRARTPDGATAQDLTSEVFLRAIRSWGRYDPGRGSVGAWLCGIARHVVADWWRRRAPEQLVDDLGPLGATALRDPGPDDPEAAALRAEAVDEVRRHLGLLTEKERDAVALRFGAGLSSSEVGATLGVSPTAARMLVYRGVGKLREVMADG